MLAPVRVFIESKVSGHLIRTPPFIIDSGVQRHDMSSAHRSRRGYSTDYYRARRLRRLTTTTTGDEKMETMSKGGVGWE